MDDYLRGAETVEEAISLQHKLYQLLMKAQMTLRKWRSSSAEVLKYIPGTLKEIEPDKDLFTPKGHPKALGVHWVASLDVLHVSIPSFGAGETIITKRSIASAVARVYDVLGWHAPAVLIVKILLRNLWQLHLGWDDKVPESITKEWNRGRMNYLCSTIILSSGVSSIPAKKFIAGRYMGSLMLLKKLMHAQSISGQYTVMHLSPHH